MSELVVEGLTRSYGAFDAIKDVSFRIPNGQFVTLLGPSGCGKSTTLWSLAGLDRPTRGSIRFGNLTIASAETGAFVRPEERNFGLVFQSYAVWPHMTVRQNLEYPLKLRKLGRREMRQKVDEITELVELGTEVDKYPFQLSGGQQQRVALARTLIYGPRLLLLDEPLSNLDAKLRMRTRVWLKDLHNRLGVSTIYVTHDQHEALAMSDEIIVMDHGRVVQRGRPEEVYLNPETPFVADFIGNSNLFKGKVIDQDKNLVALNGGELRLQCRQTPASGTPIWVSIRPEAFISDPDTVRQAANQVAATVRSVSYVGAAYELEMSAGSLDFMAISRARPGSAEIELGVAAEECNVLIRTDEDDHR